MKPASADRSESTNGSYLTISNDKQRNKEQVEADRETNFLSLLPSAAFSP